MNVSDAFIKKMFVNVDTAFLNMPTEPPVYILQVCCGKHAIYLLSIADIRYN